MSRETWIEAKSPRQANLTLTRQPQFHLPNLYVEEQGEHVDAKFQESKILNEEFEHEDVEDPSQGFVDWDSSPTYDDNVNDENSIEEPLATDLEEEYEEDGLHLIFGNFYPDKDDQLEDEQPMDDIANYEEGIAIFHEVEAPLEEVNLSYSFAIFYDNSTYHVLDKSPEDKAFDLSVRQLIMLISSG